MKKHPYPLQNALQTSSSASPHRRAFSLLELLVVIGILAVLTAILFPVFSKARAKARQTTCTSNLRQLGVALFAYTQDNDECLPFLAYNGGQPVGTEWQLALQPYVRHARIWQCPDASNYATDGIYCRSFGLPHLLAASGDSYNETAAARTTPGQIDADGPTNGKGFSPAYLSQCSHPSQTFLFMDKGYGALFTPWTKWEDRARLACLGQERTSAGPHHEGKNIAFADGHVKWLQGISITTQDQHSASGVEKDAQSPFFSYYAN